MLENVDWAQRKPEDSSQAFEEAFLASSSYELFCGMLYRLLHSNRAVYGAHDGSRRTRYAFPQFEYPSRTLQKAISFLNSSACVSGSVLECLSTP